MTNIYLLNEVYTNNFYYGFLDIISVLSVLCGILVIISKNPIVSVLFLIALFFSIASYLMMLGLNFIGLSYLLVYVGAVSILFLFILMLINVRISELVTDNNNSFVLAIMIGVLLFTPIKSKGNMFSLQSILKDKQLDAGTHNLNQTGLVEDVVQSFNNAYNNSANEVFFVSSKIWDGTLAELSHITSIGSVIYTSYPMWLIITSIILLLSMVGAIIITIKQ